MNVRIDYGGDAYGIMLEIHAQFQSPFVVRFSIQAGPFLIEVNGEFKSV